MATFHTALFMTLTLTTVLSSPEDLNLPDTHDPQFFACVQKGTAAMETRGKIIEGRLKEVRGSNTSIAPLLLHRRRLEEERCSVEAKCAAQSADARKSRVYGETFDACLEGRSRGAGF